MDICLCLLYIYINAKAQHLLQLRLPRRRGADHALGVLDRRIKIPRHQGGLQGSCPLLQISQTLPRCLATPLLLPVASTHRSCSCLLRPPQVDPPRQRLQKASLNRLQKYTSTHSDSAAITGGFTLFWLNLSPFYLKKEGEQERALKTMWQKIGHSMKIYNDMIPNATTSTSLDK